MPRVTSINDDDIGEFSSIPLRNIFAFHAKMCCCYWFWKFRSLSIVFPGTVCGSWKKKSLQHVSRFLRFEPLTITSRAAAPDPLVFYGPLVGFGTTAFPTMLYAPAFQGVA